MLPCKSIRQKLPLAYILPIEKRLWDAADELREFELEGFQEDTQA
jgi:hypothetical protein